MTIFISIASYCDPLLHFTVRRALDTARWPQALHFGVVDQSPASIPALTADFAAPARLSQVRMNPLYARGPCWARALAMSFYDGEDWFFQIDSHTDFDAGWDERLIAQASSLAAGRRGLVISAYPHPFVLQDGAVVHKPTTTQALVHVLKPGATFEADHPVLHFEAHPHASDAAVPGFHLAAGCLFAPGRLVQALPYDPHFYFHGEEQALAVRLYTHGWDIFHTPGLPIYHLYNTPDSGVPARALHWDAQTDQQRSQNWWTLEQRSRARLAALLRGDDLGVFSLGKVRSLADYAAFSGIDYAARTLAPRAYSAVDGR